MKEIIVEFTRKAPVYEKGKCILQVVDPEDAEEIQSIIANGLCKRFVVNEREYGDFMWDWEVIDDDSEVA